MPRCSSLLGSSHALRAAVAFLVVGCGSRSQAPGNTAAASVAKGPGTSSAASVATAPADVAPAHRTVKPKETDPAIDGVDDDNEVYTAVGKKNGQLLVFLPGTHGQPSNVTMFLETAASAGYMTIGLDYPDDEAAEICKRDLACYGEMRQAILDGIDVSKRVHVSPANSIVHRLVALLDYLDKHYPSKGWGAFVRGGEPAYESIAFAGHSQGGGHAAYIAKLHAVARVLMFSSVCDAADGEPPTPASWVTADHATPIDRYYGFDHTNDEFAEKIAVTWPALGLDTLGKRTSVDGAWPPYGGSHELTTSLPEPSRKTAHSAVIGNKVTPMTGSEPRYREVWRYMLTH